MKTFEFENLVLAMPEGDDGFDSLVGKTFQFFGIDCNAFKLNSIVYEALEDEDDGYRSYLGSIELKDDHDYKFLRRPLGRVRIEREDEGRFDGYRFIDVVTNHTWLTIGTDDTDDYYPYFIFNYTPDESQTLIIFQ